MIPIDHDPIGTDESFSISGRLLHVDMENHYDHQIIPLLYDSRQVGAPRSRSRVLFFRRRFLGLSRVHRQVLLLLLQVLRFLESRLLQFRASKLSC